MAGLGLRAQLCHEAEVVQNAGGGRLECRRLPFCSKGRRLECRGLAFTLELTSAR